MRVLDACKILRQFICDSQLETSYNIFLKFDTLALRYFYDSKTYFTAIKMIN